ncbi:MULTISPECIES: 50S ribosomal protein L13 [Culturomica]|uniref:50S ribosomal protein L13 n=1 Tax=Culturomica TaxID=1926651 RepID=UPI0003364873|nr:MULTISPECIES: 50S ribosomal protein L13 [Odoribacteraceae]RHV96442.1 50S ribosomal protein L13 [Odoribacter sp. OF09-27XD]CCZ10264.1 50S ribosomal protein L13 [Odoribacter sp. CAG:788]HBO26745.1 50S ribosomal protein L13 [Culturomica sp.]
MDQISYKTTYVNKATVKKEWLLIDAENEVLGRLAAKVAKLLRGKYKPSYTPHVDCGDNIVIINAEKIVLTGNKLTEKQYTRHTGYPGGQRHTNPAAVLATHPERVIEHAVKGMLPKSRLGRAVLKNLFVYAGSEHKQEAQQPKKIDLNLFK